MKYMLDLQDKTHAAIKYQAAIEKVSMNDLIEKAVNEYLSRVGVVR
jgi:predicted HicB family RNase H-like nuclease